MYLILGIIFLLVSLLMAAGIIYTICRSAKNGGELITKKNMLYLAPAFLIIYLMHLTASFYNGEDVDFFYCFSLIGIVLDVFKFDADKSLILPICRENPIFYVDFVLAFLIGGVTVILSVASFFSRRINNFIRTRLALCRQCDIVVGDSQDSVKYGKRTNNCILLCPDITNQRYTDLLKQGILVNRVPLDKKRLARKLKYGGYNIIVFRDAKYSYTKIIETFIQLTGGVKIHLEANQQEMKILKEKFITKADKNRNLYITGFNKYELMARRFVVDYPITRYIPRSFYNGNCTLKNDKEINVVFVGFGKVNYQLFRMCVMQFQFARQDGEKLASKPVHYYVLDKNKPALHNEFFSRIDYEFDEEFSDCDFPKPEKICELDISETDTNSVDARRKFKSLVNENSFTYFIISLENDLEDASYAQTVMRLFGDRENYRIFVRAKNNNEEKLNETEDKIIYFGEEKKLYTHGNIINDDLTELAQRINLLYNKTKNPPQWLGKLYEGKSAEENRRLLNASLSDPAHMEYMLEKWNALPYIEQASNLYHALNLPFKLNMLGLDMVKKDGAGITEKEFNEYYENSGRENNYSDFSFFFGTQSSNVLAYVEHSRWNALYILYDYKQMKKDGIHFAEEKDDEGNTVKVLRHKNPHLKQHACITTYYGLKELVAYEYSMWYPCEELREENYKDNPKLQKVSKIYAYDYMDLDRLYGEITAMGYKLVRNRDKNSAAEPLK